jgi:hypothetical protein
VQLIEKAYADFVRGSYKKIDGGHPSDCFRVLLGVSAEHIAHGGAPKTPQEIEILAGLFSNFLHGVYNARASRTAILDEIFHGDNALLSLWEAWNTPERKAGWTAFLHGLIGVKIRFVELEDFTSFLEREGGALNPTVKQTVLDWLSDQNPLSRKAYSPKNLDIYRKIALALRAHKPVSAGTGKDLPGASDGRGFSSGESKVAGMVATHAYAVLEVAEDDHHRLWVRIRNPWGDGSVFGYGRAYDEVKTADGVAFRPKKTSSAESWLHLDDFCDTCTDLYFGDGERSSAPTVAEVGSVDIGSGRERSGGGRARSGGVSGPPPPVRPG